ncbi:hypothetical protein Bca52824_003709 [Brassica carinata]|uniref:Uncharacterized protein n=1 Tax=Brassica carinata TaxID=52824 RepID=A0A8X8BBP4_BRACI|nr:hypothetical protein Bca52824_003709 [Brassica carinata]
MDDLRLIKESGGFRKDVKQFSASYQEPSTSREVLERQGTLLSLEGNSTEYGHGFSFSNHSGFTRKSQRYVEGLISRRGRSRKENQKAFFRNYMGRRRKKKDWEPKERQRSRF